MLNRSEQELDAKQNIDADNEDNNQKPLNVIVCWDFDWSMINENSDHFVQQKLYGEKYKKKLLPALQDEANANGVHVFTDYQDQYGWPMVFADFQLNASSFAQHLSQIPVFKENVHIVKTIDKHSNNENNNGLCRLRVNQYIVSNANDVLIDVILKKHNLNGTVFKSDQIFTNPGWYDTKTGMLRCERYHNVEVVDGETQNKKVVHFHDCELCHANLCKGKVLKEEVMPRHNRLHSYDNMVIYIGDGENDFCPVSTLKNGDYAFVRQFDEVRGLEAKVKENGDRLKCNVMTWRNGQQLLECFRKVLPSLDF